MSAVNAQPLPSPWANNNARPAGSTLTPRLEMPEYANLKEKCRQFFKKMPIVTCSIIIVCVGCYLLDWLVWLSPTVREWLGIEQGVLGDNYFSLHPLKIVKDYQVWRLLTYPFFHTGFLHLLFNLLATVPISILIERQTGSVQYFHLLSSMFIIIPSLLYTALSLILLNFTQPLPSAIGLSGVFFTLLVWQVREMPQINPCITCNLPSPAYPVVLLMVLTLILPNTSFVGHLFGLIVGYAFAYGFLNYWLLREQTIHRVEDLSPILKLSRLFSTRFISLNERIFSSSEPTDLPSFNGQGNRVGSTTNLMPTSRSGYFPILQNSPSRSENSSNTNASGNPLFPGQGRRLGG